MLDCIDRVWLTRNTHMVDHGGNMIGVGIGDSADATLSDFEGDTKFCQLLTATLWYNLLHEGR